VGVALAIARKFIRAEQLVVLITAASIA